MRGEKTLRRLQFKKLRWRILSILALFAFALASVHLASSCKTNDNHPLIKQLDVCLEVEGNSWITHNVKETSKLISRKMVRNWSQSEDTISTWFYTDTTGELLVGIIARVNEGDTKLSFSINGRSRNLNMDQQKFDTLFVGRFRVEEAGYQEISIAGLRKSGQTYADISAILIGGEATRGTVNYIKDDFYWGRRGPSVHLSYPLEENAGDIRWFYNEITVPEGQDVLGSYFMANGFDQGYFGIQVNSDTERRILFSVWSPFVTDNPAEVPEDHKIIMLRKGRDVYTGEFGNEGSGGQSYLKYNWKAGTTYSFLLKASPLKNNHTIFTAWFYAPEVKEWRLIASFQRPQTHSYLTRLHSFLENFYTETGATSRMVNYTNQWVCNTEGLWTELTRARFTADATARKNARMDYSGGSKEDSFFLKNCGFTNDHTNIGATFERKAEGKRPEIDTTSLP
jgi:Domain of unknown function (DUF3472)/Domain of unknown function (DUF5077)